MKTLNELAIEYKKNRNKTVVAEIFKQLEKTILEKAKYVFYQQLFKVGNKYFKLSQTNQVELGDVVGELNLLILNLIEKYDIHKPFDKYLYSTLWLWRPRFINADFVSQFKNISTGAGDDENEFDILENIPVLPDVLKDTPSNMTLEDYFTDLDENEKKMLKILKKNPKITQMQLAKEFGVAQQRVSEIFCSLRSKL